MPIYQSEFQCKEKKNVTHEKVAPRPGLLSIPFSVGCLFFLK